MIIWIHLELHNLLLLEEEYFVLLKLSSEFFLS